AIRRQEDASGSTFKAPIGMPQKKVPTLCLTLVNSRISCLLLCMFFLLMTKKYIAKKSTITTAIFNNKSLTKGYLYKYFEIMTPILAWKDTTVDAPTANTIPLVLPFFALVFAAVIWTSPGKTIAISEAENVAKKSIIKCDILWV